MPPKVKSVTFKNGKLKTKGTTVVHLEPDGDDFKDDYCVKVAVTGDSTKYWGGKVQSIGNDKKAMALLKYQVTPCTDNAKTADQDDDKDDGGPRDTTDVSVTITNPTTSETSPVFPTSVTVLP